MYAKNAATQVQSAPAPNRLNKYPSKFGNHENLPLIAAAPLQHMPLVKAGTWSPGTPPGKVRGVYNDGNRTDFDVVYHNTSAGQTAQGFGKFTQANYHPK